MQSGTKICHVPYLNFNPIPGRDLFKCQTIMVSLLNKVLHNHSGVPHIFFNYVFFIFIYSQKLCNHTYIHVVYAFIFFIHGLFIFICSQSCVIIRTCMWCCHTCIQITIVLPYITSKKSMWPKESHFSY